MSNTYNTETREIDGRKYHIEWQHDDTTGRPEGESDGHGVCIDLSYNPEDYLRDHDPEEDGELDSEEVVRHKMMRVLSRADRLGGYWRVYDVWETMKVAKADGWRDLKWEAEHPNATEEEKLMAAVDADFNYLQGWYNDDWHWCGITVMLLDDEGDDTEHEESLWGLCSGDADHHEEVIKELVGEIQRQVKREAEKGQTPLPGMGVDHG